MKYLIFLSILLLSAFKINAQSTDGWVYFGVTDNGKTKHYYQYKNNEHWWKEKGRVSYYNDILQKMVYITGEELGKQKVDCDGRKMKPVSFIIYSKSGKVVDSYTYNDYEQEWLHVIPDSIGESFYEKACSK